jgi:hypothetical protein
MDKFLSFNSRLLLVAVLLAITFAGMPANSRAESLLDVGQPGQAGPAAQPDKVITSGAVPGTYYLDYGYTVLNPAQFPVDGAIRFWKWSDLNGASGSYNWAALDNWIAARKAAGLETGMLITTYDGVTAGDIRGTPDYVIEAAGTVLPAYVKGSPSTPEYVNYWPANRTNYNATFDASDHNLAWLISWAAHLPIRRAKPTAGQPCSAARITPPAAFITGRNGSRRCPPAWPGPTPFTSMSGY